MKRVIIISIFFILCFVNSNAQRYNFMYPDKVSMAFYDSVKYVNPKFYPGVVIFNGGMHSAATVNICTIDNKLYFIGPENDTLAIKNNGTIDRIYILGKAYVNSKYGYVEMLETVGDITLCELRLTEIHTDAAPGAYGLKTQTSTVKTQTTFEFSHNSNGQEPVVNTSVNFDINKEISFSYRKLPFLLVEGEVYPVSKKTLAKFFPKQKKFIEEYMSEQKTNIHSVASVRELFKALNQ